MILRARKNSTYQFAAMLLQFNFNVKVNRTTDGELDGDILEVHSMKYGETKTMSVYGSLDEGGSVLLPADELKSELADIMCVVNYTDGIISYYDREFFTSNARELVKDGALSKTEEGKWKIYAEAVSGLFKLHTDVSSGHFCFWEHEGRMAYMFQTVEFSSDRDRF